MTDVAKVVHVMPSVSLVVTVGEELTLNTLQGFIDMAKAIGVPMTQALTTSVSAPYDYDQRERSPGSFSIQASG